MEIEMTVKVDVPIEDVKEAVTYVMNDWSSCELKYNIEDYEENE